MHSLSPWKRIAAAALWLAALTAPAPVAFGQEEAVQVRITQLDTSAFPRVTVHMAVTDAAGAPVGIAPERLVVLENGEPVQPQEIRGLGEAAPVTTALVIDISGSMAVEGKLEAAQDAARAYLQLMRAGDRAALVTFHTEVAVVQDITQDQAALTRAVSLLQVAKDTAMYDGIGRALDLLEGQPGRKAVLVLSDGMDNRSALSASEVLDRVDRAELSVFAIGFGNPDEAPGEYARLDEGTLRGLADNSGGSYAFASGAGQLTGLFEAVGRGLQSEYAITYVSPLALRDGVSRALTVGIASPGAAPAAESGYNPGGLVPEVSKPAGWGVFALALAALTGLLFAPGLAQRAAERIRSRRQEPAEAPTPSSRIRLGEARRTKVKLR